MTETTTLIRPAVQRSVELIDRYAAEARDAPRSAAGVVEAQPLTRRRALVLEKRRPHAS